ncbi:MAG TPA: HD domain-containing protein [Phycisphaerae bacterium]|nr:HD domain-containing protein [Phycisphaerae bacterium]
MLEELRARARADLGMREDGKPLDPVVVEHSERVAHLTQAIASLPELVNNVVDRDALTAAAWYHDAGWILELRAGRLREIDLLLGRTADRLRDTAADFLLQCLKNLLSPGTQQQAARIVRTCNQRSPALLEARILAEADNLDQIGPQAVCMIVRKQIAEGHTLADMLRAWRRQEQYRYWPAWIKECFRIPSVRLLAERRYQAMCRFMSDLEAACEMGPVTLSRTSVDRPSGVAAGRAIRPGVDPQAAG